jgi:hypothetical protein
MDKKGILTAFNNHLLEMCREIMNLFPENYNLKTCYKFIETLKSVNPRKIIDQWHVNIYHKYKEEIKTNDFSFFENKDYNDDLDVKNPISMKIISIITEIRSSVKNSSETNKLKALHYAQNLNKLCDLYFEIEDNNKL